MKVKTCYERIGHIIRNLKTKEVEDFPSNNKAKKESAKMQRMNGGLGCGYVRAYPQTTNASVKVFNGPL